MDESITHDFLAITSKLKKLMHKYHPKELIHPGEFMMLGTIKKCMEEKTKKHSEEPGVKVSELSELVHSTKSATSKMIKAIEEKGYIERVNGNQDRRVVYIRLSEKGETIIHEAICVMREFAHRTIKRMGEEDAKELVRMLDKFYQAMIEELKDKPKC